MMKNTSGIRIFNRSRTRTRTVPSIAAYIPGSDRGQTPWSPQETSDEEPWTSSWLRTHPHSDTQYREPTIRDFDRKKTPNSEDIDL
jgi:hypothetical protein